jgi:pimeloyl-ACP methyl ester carboxylesterase
VSLKMEGPEVLWRDASQHGARGTSEAHAPSRRLISSRLLFSISRPDRRECRFVHLRESMPNATHRAPSRKDQQMSPKSHLEAPTQVVEAQGIHFAYRRLGPRSGTPLLLIPHFRGGMDHWDPLVTDGLSANRPVVLFDNAGVGGSTGETPDTIEAMSDDAWAFIAALDLGKIDVLGFSIGGCVAQGLALRHAETVRRLVLVGTTPRGGEMSDRPPEVSSVAGRSELSVDDYLFLFFSPSEASRAAGRDFWLRRHLRTVDVDPPTSTESALAQRAALVEWNNPKPDRFAELKEIRQPTLVVNGNHDIMLPTINSYILAENIPQAELIIYPDAGHGSLFQYPSLFVDHVVRFLEAEPAFS